MPQKLFLSRSDHSADLLVRSADWERALALARSAGWRPRGTVLERRGEAWDGGYTQPAGQEVVGADAAALAGALQSAILAAPESERASLAELQGYIKRGPFHIC